jgi:activator of HSP90 ATPase
MLNLFVQLVKRDNRGIAQSIVVVGMVVIITGALIFTIPSARNAVNNMWGVAASMVQRIDPAQSSVSNTTSSPSSGSTSNQTPVSGSNSTTEPIIKPVQPPVTQ